jgi:hypothetical protein
VTLPNFCYPVIVLSWSILFYPRRVLVPLTFPSESVGPLNAFGEVTTMRYLYMIILVSIIIGETYLLLSARSQREILLPQAPPPEHEVIYQFKIVESWGVTCTMEPSSNIIYCKCKE